MVDCKECKQRYRADHLIEEQTDINPVGKSFEELTKVVNGLTCPNCNKQN
jgi:glycyl-tRNA synthetase